jgi:glycosyltransferase involved in cell wall biosynthesis
VGIGTSFDKWFLPFLGFALAKRLNSTLPFGVIWSMMASQASIAAARFKKAFPDKKLVLTLQEGDEEEHLKRYVFGNDFLYRLLIRPWHLLVFKRADAITAISNYLAERARRNNPSAPVEVIPNGVDTRNFQLPITNFQKEKIRKELGIKAEDKIIITTSRLVEKNGIGDLIESLRYLPEHIKLLICGTGPLDSGLKLTANRYTLNARIKFLGHIPHEQLPNYLHASDIFCRPSRSEGMGSSFIEAMAAGLPVIATPVGGIPDFLFAPLFDLGSNGSFAHSHEWTNVWKERVTGLFVKVRDPEDIAEKIKILLSNDELRNRIIANGSHMVREKYDWEGIAKQMKEVLTRKT